MEFDGIYEQFADRVYSYLKFKLRDTHLIEDIFQDTFLSVYTNLDKAPRVRSMKAWILTIAHHKMVDRLRKSKMETSSEIELEQAHEASPEHRLILRADLSEMLSRLDDVSRTIMYCIYVESLTYREVAQLTGLSEGTVKSKCYYAKRKLMNWMEEG